MLLGLIPSLVCNFGTNMWSGWKLFSGIYDQFMMTLLLIWFFSHLHHNCTSKFQLSLTGKPDLLKSRSVWSRNWETVSRMLSIGSNGKSETSEDGKRGHSLSPFGSYHLPQTSFFLFCYSFLFVFKFYCSFIGIRILGLWYSPRSGALDYTANQPPLNISQMFYSIFWRSLECDQKKIAKCL